MNIPFLSSVGCCTGYRELVLNNRTFLVVALGQIDKIQLGQTIPDSLEMIDWELMSEQIVRHVHESLPRDLDSPLSSINRPTAAEPSTTQESSSGENPSLALEKNRWEEPCEGAWRMGN